MGNCSPIKIKRSQSEKKDSNNNYNPNILVSKRTPIGNDYKFLTVLGEGMNGKVYMCMKKSTNKKYALKRLLDTKYARREIDLQWRTSLNCDHIVKIKDLYENKVEDKKYLYVVMEYMEGGELFDRIKKKRKFTEKEVAKIMKQVCTAVNHLHSMGIAHRDLKPENLLLTSKDDNAIIKLSDFGFAKESYRGLTTPNYTPSFVPPEILSFEKHDISCDIWSLGVIMYILCCGYPPFYSIHGHTLSPGMKKKIKRGEFEFPPADWLNVSQEAKNLIKGMLETIPEKRLKIDQIMNSDWILNCLNAPNTKLKSLKVLNSEDGYCKKTTEDMRLALENMRVNDEKNSKIQNIDVSNNPILKRRLAKNKNNSLTKKPITELDENKSEEAEKINKNDTTPNKISSEKVLYWPEKSTIAALYYSSSLKEFKIGANGLSKSFN